MRCMVQWRQNTRYIGTIKRAELTAFLCLLKKVTGPIKVHVDNKGVIDGLRKEKRNASSQEREMQNYGKNIWEEIHGLVERGILVEAEHVKAHRTKKEQTNTQQFEKFVTEGNEKADELAKSRGNAG